MNKRRERFKNCIILLLSVSAVFFGFQAGIFNAPIRAQVLATSGTQALAQPFNSGSQSPFLPTQIAVNLGPEGSFTSGVNTPDATVLELGEDSLPFLHSALQSLGAQEEVPYHLWAEALGSWGILFSFSNHLSLSDFSLLFAPQGNLPVGQSRALYLSLKESGVFLYFLGTDNEVFRAPTNVNRQAFSLFIEGTSPNASSILFDFEAGLPAIGHSTYTNFPVITAQTAHMYQHLELLLQRFDFNPSLVRYVESDGVRTMVEEGATLRIFEDGLITYQYQGQNPRLLVTSEEVPTLAQAILAAYRLASLVSIVAGDAQLSFREYTYQNGRFVIEFEYLLHGVPVLGAYPAARVVIDGRFVREVSLFAQHFSHSGEFSSILSTQQAQLAAGGQGVRLLYVEEVPQSGRYTLTWILQEGQVG